MSDAQVSVVLTQQKFALELPRVAKHVICLDTDWVAINLESQQNPVAGTKIDNLAYVMYTSGSTGRPKGVSVIHRGVVRLVKQTNYASFSSQLVFLQLAPTAFDASTFEIWGSLLNGARLVLFPGNTPSVQELGQVIQQHQITTLWLTAGLFHLMVDEQLEALQPLRQLLAGGDVLSVPHVRKLFQKLKNCTLINGYGPTENTTFTCCFAMTASCQIGDSVPIGRPIANTQTYILDRHLQPVPIGVPGELYVGGAGVAREYLNRPELTAERFIANPFVDGERLYKTGDLVRYLADGNIEFLGRIDLQVKIRGFRIEPGEIEAVMSQHPHVQQVVVTVRSDRLGDKYLAAYVVPAETQMLSVEELRQFVRQHLPEYMIPTAFVMLNAFPLNANGKVDRRALPKPNLELSREINFVAPRTPTEVVIASIMATVLGLERFGIYDNFFALGGHSLLATQVISRLRSAFAVELPLRCLFESPTVASLDKFISEEQTDLAQLFPAITPVSKNTTEFPLSFAQERLWFLNQLEGETATYNMPFVVRIAGNLNFNALESAIQEIVQRHAILRTNFQVVNGSTVQVIKPTATIPLFVVLHEPTGEEQLLQLATLEAQTSFDLSVDSLVRVKLLQLSEQEHFLLLTMHHIVSDGWSMGIFIQELSALYQAFCEGNPSPLPELPIQYVDYAVWQRQWLTSEVLERQLNYWEQHLAGAPPLLELPYDRPRKAVQTFRGGSVPFEIDAQLTQQLKILSQESGVTLFMTGLAAFVTLLFRYSGQSDILVGSPIANRHHRETDSLIGFFVNTIVLRTQILDNPSFKQLLHQVRLVALGAYTHQDVPFEQVVEALQPERSLSHSPLFQVMFDLLQESEHWELPGLSLTPVETENAMAKFDLTLSLENTDTGLRGAWEYNSDLFNRSTIVRMSSHFQTLLAGIIAHPEQSVEQLPLLSDQQRHQLLVAWNNTQREYPQHSLHELFEQQVQRSPDLVAVEFAGEHLTYRELDHRANQLANYLQTLGVGPETLVGICVERDITMVVGLLGILKAGGAYVPLDPNYPQERLAFTLSNSQATVLLTQEKLASVLPEQDVHCVYLDRDWQAIAQQKPTRLNSSVRPENLAYVIYTSGSTGQPKGVMIQHQSAVNFIVSAKHDITQSDRVLQFVSIAFDAAVEDIFTCLTSGGTLVLRTDEMLLSASRFVQRCRDWNLTVLDLPTSYWHQMMVELATADVTLPESVRLVIVGGEQAMPETLKLWHDSSRLHNQAKLLNRYGPTETTVASTCCDLSDFMAKHPACSTVPIGCPMDNVCTYVLDRNLQPVPIGVVGELHIGGIGLARGYLGRPEATAEKFIPNPFSNEPGSRLYKTGDLVRHLADGNIEYLGRIDQQVKVRGFRIELLEIESVLTQHPAVAQAVVVVREEQPDNKYLIAYIVATEGLNGTENLTHKIKADLRQQLPEYMVPATIVMLSALPLTTNGKVDRRALPTPDSVVRLQALEMPQTEVDKLIAHAWQKVLLLEKVGLDDNFFDVGGNSLRLVQVREELQTIFNQELSMVEMFQHPTVRALGQYLSGQANRTLRSETLSTSKSLKQQRQRQQFRSHKSEEGASDIAIIAMSGRFPGANNIDAFWENLRNGVESVSWLCDEELLAAGVQPELLQNPNYVRASAVLDDIELFDANFFGFNPKEAEILDPQNRLFLECAWETLEQAGYDPQTYAGSIGVYAGVGASDYLLENLYPNQALKKSVGMYQLMLATEKDFLPTRAAYKLNLTGPAVNIQTACSTSLVAVHMACQSLLNGECEMALAGGVTISIPQKAGYLYQEGMILSPDGHCRAFDAKAQGTIGGSGVGIVMLKRTKDAIADRDYIYAIIKGSAINNDGVNKIGFTAPSVEGQAEVIAEAQAKACVDTETITYVETHGTGTTLGDPIEIAALTQAFRQSSDKKHFCAIGSVKTNMGHLDTASGVAGLIKTVLALKHKQLPPSLHFETPNPKIDFANSPFYVNTQLSEWKTDDTPRRAGVSSFGIGGTNAHVVLEEAPVLRGDNKEQTRPVQLLVLSAKTSSALEAATNNLTEHLKQHPELDLADVAYTLSVGRQAFEHRRILVSLDASVSTTQEILTGYTRSSTPSVIFMFSGQGSQYVNMAREIYQTEPIFTEQVDYCAELLQPELGLDLRDILYPSPDQTEEATKQLQQTAITQPALFTIEYALAKLWESWGIQPQGFIGHSIGEYVAACLADVFSLSDALSLVAFRGRMMQQIPPGAMLSVPLAPEAVEPLLGTELSLAAINEPSRCVVSGPKEAVAALQNHLVAQGIECVCLRTSHGFHSQMMDPILEQFGQRVQKITLRSPKIPYISNITGTWITAAQATDPHYWSQHLRLPVQFALGIEHFLKQPDNILLEVGPGRTLSTLALHHPSKEANQIVLTSLRHPQEKSSDMALLLTSLGQIWLAGVKVNWSGFYAQQQRYRVPLPTYPFERQRYWVEGEYGQGDPAPTFPLSSPGKKQNVADWFYIPSWKQSPLSMSQLGKLPASVLLFVDGCGLGEHLAQQLQQKSNRVIQVQAGQSFAIVEENLYVLNPQRREDYVTLFNQLTLRGGIPKTIVHCWSLTEQPTVGLELAEVENALKRGFYSLLFLAQAFGKQHLTDEYQLLVLSNNMQEVTGDEKLYPQQATLIGPVKVIPKEYPNLYCRSIDIILHQPGTPQAQRLMNQLQAELAALGTSNVVAYRGQHRWVQTFEPVRLEQSDRSISRLKQKGVYLITGGLGGIGLTLAHYLAKTVQAKLILTGRSGLPARDTWEQWLLNHDERLRISRQIRSVQELERLGSQVFVVTADVTNLEQMHSMLAEVEATVGKINGVIHGAGVPSGGLIQQRTREETEKTLAAKVQGTLVLNALFQNKSLDFFVLLSSLNAIFPAVGQIDYCAANAFLDAFARYHNANHRGFSVSINWDGWQFVGMAAEAAKQFAGVMDFQYLEQGLLPEEGVAAFERIISDILPQVMVSTVALKEQSSQESVLVETRYIASFQESVRDVPAERLYRSQKPGGHSRPQLNNPYIAPRNPIEQAIAEVWQEFLGIQQIGIYDNYLDLGGDSLLATQIVARLRDIFAIKLSLASLFETPTVADIAASLNHKSAPQPQDKPDELSDREEIVI